MERIAVHLRPLSGDHPPRQACRGAETSRPRRENKIPSGISVLMLRRGGQVIRTKPTPPGPAPGSPPCRGGLIALPGGDI
mgnify:CR=1 FL=1